MREPKIKWRDIAALPFGLLTYLFGLITVQIGGQWTAWTILVLWGKGKDVEDSILK